MMGILSTVFTKLIDFLHLLPRKHQVLLGLLSIFLFVVAATPFEKLEQQEQQTQNTPAPVNPIANQETDNAETIQPIIEPSEEPESEIAQQHNHKETDSSNNAAVAEQENPVELAVVNEPSKIDEPPAINQEPSKKIKKPGITDNLVIRLSSFDETPESTDNTNDTQPEVALAENTDTNEADNTEVQINPEPETEAEPATEVANNIEPIIEPITKQGEIEPAAASQSDAEVTQVELTYYTVEKNGSLALIFNRAGLTPKDLYDITSLPIAKNNLIKLFPNDVVGIAKDDQGDLKKLTYRLNPTSTLVITQQDGTYLETISVNSSKTGKGGAQTKPTSTELAKAKAEIEKTEKEAASLADNENLVYYPVKKNGSLALVFKRAGLTPKEAYDVASLPIAYKTLQRLFPEEELGIAVDDEGKLQQFNYRLNRNDILVITREGDKYVETIVKKKSSSITTTKPKKPAVKLTYYKVKKNDSLALLFKRAGLTPQELYSVTRLYSAKKNLVKLMPNEEIGIAKNKKGQLQQLNYRLNELSSLVITRKGNRFQEQIVKLKTTKKQARTSSTIKDNFWNAGIQAKMTPALIMQLATIFGWDIDFGLDIRKGDHFSIIYEKIYVDDHFVRDGVILAAEFVNQGDKYTAIRYKDGNYYSANGRSVRKPFLRAPVDFNKVSSNFNPRRLHPVTGQVRPHQGVDYVAPVGTPIKAAGDGKVIEASYNRFNGNYVFIKHNNTYTTKYLHLKKRNVKRGQTVKQGQIIGYLGSTGRVTGAHLHYEFIVNGVHRNPRTVKLPKSLPIDRREKAAFDRLSKKMMAELAR